MKQKVCTKCNETKPTSEFNKHRMGKDGLRAACSSCVNENSRRWREVNKARKTETDRRWHEQNPKRRAYIHHKAQAKQRGIEFLLTFEEFRDWWGEDFADRGCTKGKLVMARYGDKGPYALGNIKKLTCSENVREFHDNRKSKNQSVPKVQGCG